MTRGCGTWPWPALLAACLFGLAACTGTIPYQPAQAEIEHLPADAFQRVVEVVRSQYPRLAVVEADAFHIQSNWTPHERGELTGAKRATVYLDEGDVVCVVVETRYLGVSLTGDASWTSVRADPKLERELLQALVGALEH